MGANLYRVVDGTLQKNVDIGELNRIAGNVFAAMHFPSMPCHLWNVVKVGG